eukprot:751191-Hanusia_phi.AAC.1
MPMLAYSIPESVTRSAEGTNIPFNSPMPSDDSILSEGKEDEDVEAGDENSGKERQAKEELEGNG